MHSNDLARSADRQDTPGAETFVHLLHRGSELLRDGQPRGAREHLERALALYPQHAAARNLLALSLFQLGSLEHALIIYESLQLDFPDSIAARVNLALVLLKLGRASAARPLLEEALRRAPEHRRAWGYLGVAFEQLGLIAEAEAALLVGHYSSAARRLHDRHEGRAAAMETSIPEVTRERARGAMPATAYRRKTLPPDPWANSTAAAPALAVSHLHKFTVTLRPPDLVRGSVGADGSPKTTPPPCNELGGDASCDMDGVEEIPFETTIAPAPPPPPALSNAPKGNRPVVPLLDAALSSLLVVPHEASVVVHPTGLVLVGLAGGGDPLDGGFAVRVDALRAFAGTVRREPMPRREPLTPQPFCDANAPFHRLVGTGQLVLSPPSGSRLLPLDMDADVAFLREDLVVAFDHSLLYDLGRIRRSSRASTSLVRFRGDGVIVLRLEHPFLAFDVHGDEAVTLRSDALIGWIGLLVPEIAESASPETPGDFLTFSGEGTVLFRAPREA